jgi:hypothetical protein
MDFSNIQEEMEIPLKRERLCTRFGPASKILGMEIQRDRKSGTLALSQRRFVEKLLELFGMSKAKPVKTPFAPHLLLSSEQSKSRKRKRR